MTFQLELWHVITLLITLIAAFFGLIKMLLGQQIIHIDAAFAAQNKRLEKIEEVNREESSNWQNVERALMKLKADLPLEYVLRNDYIRGQSVIESKIDSLALKLENAQLRALFQNPPGEPTK